MYISTNISRLYRQNETLHGMSESSKSYTLKNHLSNNAIRIPNLSAFSLLSMYIIHTSNVFTQVESINYTPCELENFSERRKNRIVDNRIAVVVILLRLPFLEVALIIKYRSEARLQRLLDKFGVYAAFFSGRRQR